MSTDSVARNAPVRGRGCTFWILEVAGASGRSHRGDSDSERIFPFGGLSISKRTKRFVEPGVRRRGISGRWSPDAWRGSDPRNTTQGYDVDGKTPNEVSSLRQFFRDEMGCFWWLSANMEGLNALLYFPVLGCDPFVLS